MPCCVLFIKEFKISSLRDGITEETITLSSSIDISECITRRKGRAYIFVCVFSCTSGTQTGGTTSSDLLCILDLLLEDTSDRDEAASVCAMEQQM